MAMHARPGDRLVLAAPHTSDATRDGEVLEARGPDGQPPYLVRWSDGHEGLIYPGPGSLLRVGHPVADEPPEASAPDLDRPAGHVRDWEVRISIFERGDETDANVVLLADSPQHLTARGHAERSTTDRLVPEIGDEVAVARALRRLADRLLGAAQEDISDITGEEHVTVKP
jgi:hypothetical protein